MSVLPLTAWWRAGLLCALLSRCPSLSAQTPALENGDLVAICGDSITEQKLYSQYMEVYMLACQPAAGLQASQFGWGGETAEGFLGRMQNDVLGFKPTVATLCYGMNDGGYRVTEPERLKNYRESLRKIVETFKGHGVRSIVVGSPGVVDSDAFKRPAPSAGAEVYNKTLADFGAAAQEVARQEGVGFADVHQVMTEVMAKLKDKYGPDYPLAGKRDGIHPDENGHLVMAYTFLKALGCKGDIGTLTYDAAARQATATDGHRVLAASGTGFQVESTRYPFCFTGDPSKPDSTRGVIEALPFNQDLNRFVLVVKNSRAKHLRITWGDKSKDFDAAKAAAGINLASEFLDNPFSEPFAALSKAVLQQQRYETSAVKELLHQFPAWKQLSPGGAEVFNGLQAQLIEADAALRKASAAALRPVRHSVEIVALD